MDMPTNMDMETSMDMQTCADNTVIPADETCMKTCPNGTEIPENNTCPQDGGVSMQTCADNTVIPASETCMKTCTDNSAIPENETCMKTCADNSTIPENETCMKTCANGTKIPENQVCMQTCGDGTQRPESANCAFATTEFARNYGLRNMNTESAYLRGYLGASVTVGVIDSGVHITHEDLKDNIVPGRDFTSPASAITDPGNHGTPVAGIIAASRNNTSGHGVAPLAKILPLKIADSFGQHLDDPTVAFEHAVNMKTPIVNNSYGSVAPLMGTYRGESYRADIPHIFGNNNFITEFLRATSIEGEIENADIVAVWAAGNEGWHPNGMVELCSATTVSFVAVCPDTAITLVSRADFINEFTSMDFTHLPSRISLVPGLGVLSTVSGIERTFASRQSLWPYYVSVSPSIYADALATTNFAITDPDFNGLAKFLATVSGEFTAIQSDLDFISLTERYLVAVAVDADNEIADYSNGCGNTSSWCLAAPGDGVSYPSADGDDSYQPFSGTSAAAPHVSGALAILKSAAPMLPMTMIRAILLTTATDLGEPGRDDIYGWGLVNISAGITHIENMRVATSSAGTRGEVKMNDFSHELPDGYRYLHDRMSGMKIAVEITDNAYYNMPLSDLLRGGKDSPVSQKNAAKDILHSRKENTPLGFSAFGDSETAMGLRWKGDIGFLAEFAHVGNDGRLDNANFGALGQINAKTNRGKVRIHRELTDGLAAFGEYLHGDINTKVSGGEIPLAVQNATTDEWTAGVQLSDVWQKDDLLRLSANQKERISGGEMILQTPVANGDFYRAFLGESKQTLSMQQTAVPLKQKTGLVWTLGYSTKTDDNEWAAAASYDNDAGNGKLSAAWRVNL